MSDRLGRKTVLTAGRQQAPSTQSLPSSVAGGSGRPPRELGDAGEHRML
ncbi:hypothetical protein ABT112_20875 [Streptomyces sp. NPDC002055]